MMYLLLYKNGAALKIYEKEIQEWWPDFSVDSAGPEECEKIAYEIIKSIEQNSQYLYNTPPMTALALVDDALQVVLDADRRSDSVISVILMTMSYNIHITKDIVQGHLIKISYSSLRNDKEVGWCVKVKCLDELGGVIARLNQKCCVKVYKTRQKYYLLCDMDERVKNYCNEHYLDYGQLEPLQLNWMVEHGELFIKSTPVSEVVKWI